MQKIISIQNGVTRMPEWRMAEPVNFEACDGEHIAIVGPNGGGKSMFVDILDAFYFANLLHSSAPLLVRSLPLLWRHSAKANRAIITASAA